MARLRGLEPPDVAQVKRLREELSKLSGQAGLDKDSLRPWDSAYDDDLAVLRSGVGKGSRLTNWMKLGIGILRWELWGRRKVCCFMILL